MTKYYLILYRDGSIAVTGIMPEHMTIKKDDRLFRCDGNITITDIAEWSHMEYPSLKINNKTIQEIDEV